MTHDEVLDRLDDWVAAELPDNEQGAVDLHLEMCPACRAEADSLRELLAEVANLPTEILPERELWSGIAARIEAEPVATHRRWRGQRWLGMAAAAILLVVSSSLLTLHLSERRIASRVTAPAEWLGRSGGPPTALVSFEPAERDYQNAIAELQTVLAARKGQLAPETVRTLETNLRIIDEAIAQSRAALERDPNSAELTQMLTDAYDQKMNVLSRVVEL
ncbi:MAG TPA: zf-HC2 domain-containing protein [Longimicrobium sp.]|jgi:anti-sigma factor RsiW